MSELVKIPIASAEYLARFDRPYIGLLTDARPKVFEAVVDALLPFNFRLANTEIVTVGNPAEHKVIFRLPDRAIAFEFGAEQYRFTKDQSSWVTASDDVQVLRAAQRALLDGSGAKIALSTVTIAMHMQPLVKPREQILAPFLPEPFKNLMAERKVQTFGNHLKWADGDVLLDFSLALANGIFVRLSSQFQGQPPLEEMLTKIRNDEKTLFGILGVEEATNA